MNSWRGAAAICLNDRNELLMVLQGRPGEEKRWSVPSGGANDEESYEACCAREVWEETGYTVNIGSYLHQKSGVSRGTLYKVNYYEAEITGGAPSIQDPDGLIHDVGWKSAEDIETLALTYPEDRRFLLDMVMLGRSGIVFRSNPLTVRRMTLADSPLLLKWLNDPEVLRYYEGRDRPHTPAMVREYYNPDDDDIFRCILEHNDKPIGYMQYYPLDEEARVRWGLNERATEEITFGMDQFIGEPAYWNQGIGQMWLSSALQHVAERHQAASIMLDPQTWNERAVACYEKVGFRILKRLPEHEQHEGERRDCWLMEWRMK